MDLGREFTYEERSIRELQQRASKSELEIFQLKERVSRLESLEEKHGKALNLTTGLIQQIGERLNLL